MLGFHFNEPQYLKDRTEESVAVLIGELEKNTTEKIVPGLGGV